MNKRVKPHDAQNVKELSQQTIIINTAYIVEVKRDLDLPMYDAPNAVEKLKESRKHPTPVQEDAIKDALEHFKII